MLQKQNGYQTEARELANNLASKMNTDNRVWVMYNISNPADKLLLDALKTKFSKYSVIEPPQPRKPSWFDVVIVFQK